MQLDKAGINTFQTPILGCSPTEVGNISSKHIVSPGVEAHIGGFVSNGSGLFCNLPADWGATRKGEPSIGCGCPRCRLVEEFVMF